MIKQEQVDKISDEFNSTFAMISKHQLSNCFFPNERPVVEELIRKHIPGVKSVDFVRHAKLGHDYSIWVITIET